MISQKTIGGAPVHPIGIGTWDMGGGRYEDGTIFADYRYDDREIKAIRYSIEKGQNHIDTAQIYGAGHTEEIVGKAIRGAKRETLYIASKLWSSHLQRDSVVRQVEIMLEKMGTDYLDLLYVHAPWDVVPMAEYLGGMNVAVGKGLVRSLGVSNFNMDQLQAAVGISDAPIVADQLHYNIVDRGLVTAKLLNYAADHEIAIVAYRPVERKLLAENTENEVVIDIASKYQRPMSHIAINWLVGQKSVVTIPKSSTPAHIDENLEALDFTLADEDRETLDAVAVSTQENIFGG